MYGSGSCIKNSSEAHNAVMGAATATGADGNRSRVAAFASLPGDGGYEVFTYLDLGIVHSLKSLHRYFSGFMGEGNSACEQANVYPVSNRQALESRAG